MASLEPGVALRAGGPHVAAGPGQACPSGLCSLPRAPWWDRQEPAFPTAWTASEGRPEPLLPQACPGA